MKNKILILCIIIQLITISLINININASPLSESDDGSLILVDDPSIYELYGFNSSGMPIYRKEGLCHFNMPFIINKDNHPTLSKSSLGYNVENMDNNFVDRQPTYNGDIIASNKDYYVINYEMNVKASNKSFSIDFQPIISGKTYNEFAWFDSNYSYRLDLWVDSDQVIDTMTDFPVLVYFNQSTLIYDKVQTDLDDIIFVDDTNTTEFNYEIEWYNVGGGIVTAFIWVNITSINSGSDTHFNMYFGNSTTGSNENPTGVWHTRYYGVYHMKMDGLDDMIDSTVNGNDWQDAGTPAQTEDTTNGWGYQCDFTPTDSFGHSNTFSDMSLTMVGYDSTFGAIRKLFYFYDTTRINCYYNNGDGTITIGYKDSNGWAYHYPATNPNNTKFVLSFDFVASDYSSCFWDGLITGYDSGLGAQVSESDTNNYICADAGGADGWDGKIDEFRVLEEGLTNAYHVTEHNSLINVTTDTPFIIMGDEISGYEEPVSHWENNCSFAQNEYPTNNSIDIGRFPICSITAIDYEVNHTINITFATNESGSWINKQTNSSVANNTVVSWNFTDADTNNTHYFWRVYLDDTFCNHSFTYDFTTLAGDVPEEPEENETTNVTTSITSGNFTVDLNIDDGILGLIITLVFFICALYFNDKKPIICGLLLILVSVISLPTGIYYINAETFYITWWIGVLFILFSAFSIFFSMWTFMQTPKE